MLDVQQAQFERSGTARQTRTSKNGDGLVAGRQPDGTAEKENIVWRVVEAAIDAAATAEIIRCTKFEDARVLEKKLAFFRKEETEPCEVDLLLVGLDLCKVRVVREVQRKTGSETVLGIESDVGILLVDTRRLVLGIALVHVRLESNIGAGLDPFEPFQRASKGDAIQVIDPR